MIRKLIATTSAAGIAAAGLILAAPAAQADDVKVRKGSCSGASNYTMRLADRGDDPDRLRTTFTINSNKANKRWTVTFKRGDTVVFRDAKRTGARGNVQFGKTFRADDDALITVIARAGYGETCKRSMRLDD